MAAIYSSLSLMGASFLEQLSGGVDKWWSDVTFTASKTTYLGGVAQQGLDDGCVMMDARGKVSFSGAMVAPTASLARSMLSFV